jgi:hypothetical protein
MPALYSDWPAVPDISRETLMPGSPGPVEMFCEKIAF